MSKETKFKSSGPPGPGQNMESSRTSQQSQLLKEDESSTSKVHAKSHESSSEATGNPSEEVGREPNSEDSYCFAQNPYVQHYYTQYVHMYHVLDKGLEGINSELHAIGRSLYKLASSMKECSHTMGFYVTRMLSLQRETLYALDKTNNNLESAVNLLCKIKGNKEQRPQGSSSATQYMDREKLSLTSNGINKRRKEEHGHRSRSEDRSTQHRKRFKEK